MMSPKNAYKRSGKVPLKIKFSYAIGELTDSTGYNVFYVFFLFFMTDVAGIPPAVAGTISLISVMYDAFTDPIMGFITDNFKGKHGRRRPFMIGATVPYALCTFLLLNNVPLEGNIKYAYYLLIALAFWTSFKNYVTPYFALGTELTYDYNERTSVRTWSSFFMNGGVMLASSTPLLIVDFVKDKGGTTYFGWNVAGMVIAGFMVLCAVICLYNTRGTELSTQEGFVANQDIEKESIFRNALNVLKLRPMKFLAASVFLQSAVYSIMSSGLVYLMTYNLGYSADKQSMFFLLQSLLAMCWLPVINLAANKFDKKRTYATALAVGVIDMMIFNFVGFHSFGFLVAFIAIYQFANTSFWNLYIAMMCDISELDEFKTGKRREGTVSATLQFCQKLGGAFSLWFVGFILDLSGYDSTLTQQAESALSAIHGLITWIPGTLGIFAVVFACLYPVTKKRFDYLFAALTAKKNGKEYSTEGFEKLL